MDLGEDWDSGSVSEALRDLDQRVRVRVRVRG